jgi:hypothetical protein
VPRTFARSTTVGYAAATTSIATPASATKTSGFATEVASHTPSASSSTPVAISTHQPARPRPRGALAAAATDAITPLRPRVQPAA